jgi:hypothetical protein
MVAVAGAILDTAGVAPINAAATAHPNERTVRFYVTRGLMTPPDGRGTAATYSYRHLLQILGIKLRQMEGATLKQIETELGQTTGDVLERRVAAVLGPALPAPGQLDLEGRDRPAVGRAGRVLHGPGGRRPIPGPSAGTLKETGMTWQRIAVSRGVELHINEGPPLARSTESGSALVDAVRAAVVRLMEGSPPAGREGQETGPAEAHTPRK